MSSLTRPVLRWHVGKWILAPWIISNLPPHRIYTEVYGGAASVLIRKSRSYSEVYNDLDGEVVNLFRVLQNKSQSDELVGKLLLTPFAREEFELAYEQSSDPVERARRLIILSFMSFGSNGHNVSVRTGFRSNSNRSGTTPAHDWANYPDCLKLIVDRLRGVVIESRPAIEVLRQHDGLDTLHYVDPPYVHSTRKGGKHKDYRYEMTDADHRDLSLVLHQLTGMIVLSGYQSALYDELYGDWRKIERTAKADGGRDRIEVLWINDAAHVASMRLL